MKARFILTDMRFDGALAFATVTEANGSKFEITVGQCDRRIKRNTSGKWDDTVFQAAGIVSELHHTALVYCTEMPETLVVDEKELRRWQGYAD